MEVRSCPKCSVEVVMTPARKKHGRAMCNQCSNKAVTAWVKENPERARKQSLERTRRWQAKNPGKLPTAQEKRAYDRKHHFQKKYGITEADYDALVRSQHGLCAICSCPPNGRYGRLHVDHDHITGKVRGLLCSTCNQGLGLFEDSIAILRDAIIYLQEKSQ